MADSAVPPSSWIVAATTSRGAIAPLAGADGDGDEGDDDDDDSAKAAGSGEDDATGVGGPLCGQSRLLCPGWWQEWHVAEWRPRFRNSGAVGHAATRWLGEPQW